MARRGMSCGVFLAPFHELGENPTLAIDRDMELIEWLDHPQRRVATNSRADPIPSTYYATGNL